jgi:hypothetical protein
LHLRSFASICGYLDFAVFREFPCVSVANQQTRSTFNRQENAGMKHEHRKLASWTTFATLWLALLLVSTSAWAGVRALVDRNQLYEGDTVTLTVEAEGESRNGQPDLAPLQQDFEVSGVSTSNQVSIINGQRSDKTQWVVQLKPRRLGELRIPAIAVGGDQTRPIALQVREIPPELAKALEERLFVEVELEPSEESPYVQQQLRYVARLYYAVPLIDGTLSDPQPENAVVERLGQDRQYRTQRNGKEYGVIERRYAIFPERSGEFHIPPVTFEGRVASGSSARNSRTRMSSMMERFFSDDFFRDPFGNDPFFNADDFFAGTPLGDRGRPIRATGKSLTLEVEPQPAAYGGPYWLPASNLVIHDSWSENPPQWRAGEPVARTLTIEAKGLTASQLPELEVQESPQIRVYSEPPVGTSHTDGNWVYGRSEQNLAYVARQEGKLSVPSITVHWWDTEQNRERRATLPPWEVQVAAGSVPVPGEAPAAPAEREESPVPATALETPGKEPTGLPGGVGSLTRLWPWGAGLAALLAVLVAASAVVRQRSRGRAGAGRTAAPSEPRPQPRQSDRAARAALQRACDADDAQACAAALLDWAAVAWPDDPPRNLGVLANRAARGTAQIRDLDRALYAADAAAWRGAPLWEALKDGLRARDEADRREGDGILKPLYPSHT